MRKVQIIQGKDNHTVRLLQSMQMCNADIFVAKTLDEVSSSHYNLILIDPSIDFDPSSKLNGDIHSFYDCEDSPMDYKLGTGYESMRDKVDFYCKMDWIGEKWQNHKLTGFPNPKMLSLVPVSKVELPGFTEKNAIPFFVGVGTFIGNYKPESNFTYETLQDITALGELNNELIYSQRIDWILSLNRHRVSSYAKLVFNQNSNLSIEWQKNIFGKGVSSLGTPRITMKQYLSALFQYRIGLNPTGHARNSWRMFDIMATGAILVSTDIEGYSNLYSPASKIIIKDSESLGERIETIRPRLHELIEEARLNREIVQQLTPDIIWRDFIDQFK